MDLSSMLEKFERNEKRVYGYCDLQRSTMFIENMKKIETQKKEEREKAKKDKLISNHSVEVQRPFLLRLQQIE